MTSLYEYVKSQMAHCDVVARTTCNGQTQSAMMSMRDAYQDVLDHMTVEDASKEVDVLGAGEFGN
jgi:DNA-binding IscR family transcriptional regulator